MRDALVETRYGKVRSVSFARTGNPNTPELPNWPIYNTDHRATMLFDEECRVVDDPQAEESRLWKGLL